jgi:DNA-binding CsgD family transcriptional regulator
MGVCQAHRLDLADAEWHLRQAVALAGTPFQRGLGIFSLARLRGACGAPGEAVDLLGQALRDLADDSTSASGAVPAPVGSAALVAVSAAPASPGGAEPTPNALIGRLQAELIGAARAAVGRRAELLEHLTAYQRRPDASQMVILAQHAAEELFAGASADTVAELARRAVAAGPLPPDCAMLWAPVHALMITDRLAEAENCLSQALDFSVHRAAAFSAALLEGQLARLSWLRGELSAARVHLAAAAEGLTAPDGALSVLQPVAVDLLLADERYEEADAALRASTLSGPRAPETVWQLWLLDARIRLNMARGEYGAVHADAMLCHRAYTAWGAEHLLEVPWRLYAARASRHFGKPERAAELVDEHLSIARAFGAPRYIALALRAAAALAETPARAEGLLREAIELLEIGPARLEQAATLERLGTLLAREGDRAGAVAVRGRAARLAERCDATALAQRLRALTAPEPAPAAPPRFAGVDAFTPAERQVTELVIKGLTNRQVARRLFLSEKTVEAHLSRAYRKAGVRSRTQLTARLSATSAG